MQPFAAFMPSQNGHAPEPPELPVDSFREAAPHLRRPFAPNAVRFKLQTQFGGKKQGQGREQKYVEAPTGGLIVAYIDARSVIDRLNTVCPHLWLDSYELQQAGPNERKLMRCRLTIDGITREDVGEGNGKGLYSDALKRAAVKFGIGMSIYALPKVILNVEANGLSVGGNAERGFYLKLTDRTLDRLRGGYAKWLKLEGEQAFGEALDHGDAEQAVGDPLDPDRQEPDEEPDQPIPDPAEGQRPKPTGRKISAERAEQLAARFNAEAPEEITPDDLNLKLRELTGREGSNIDLLKSLVKSQAEELERWLDTLKQGVLA